MSGTEIRYSEAFKQKVVGEVASGRFRSPYEAARAYGVKDSSTVRRWMRQYGKGEQLRKVVRVEAPDEPGRIKELEDRVRELESTLANAYMDGLLSRAQFELLCEQTGTDPEAFKKKHAAQVSRLRGRSR